MIVLFICEIGIILKQNPMYRRMSSDILIEAADNASDLTAEWREPVVPRLTAPNSVLVAFSDPQTFVKLLVRKDNAQRGHPRIHCHVPYGHLVNSMTEDIRSHRQDPIGEIYASNITCAVWVGKCLQIHRIYLHCYKPVYEFAKVQLCLLGGVRIVDQV